MADRPASSAHPLGREGPQDALRGRLPGANHDASRPDLMDLDSSPYSWLAVAGSNASEHELMQYRLPVGLGPSLKTWPR